MGMVMGTARASWGARSGRSLVGFDGVALTRIDTDNTNNINSARTRTSDDESNGETVVER